MSFSVGFETNEPQETNEPIHEGVQRSATATSGPSGGSSQESTQYLSTRNDGKIKQEYEFRSQTSLLANGEADVTH